MNYKLLKIGYLTLGAIILIICALGIIFIDSTLGVISPNTMIIISACLCFPMFALKLLHEQKYPPTRRDKIFSVIIIFAGLIFIFMV